MADYSLKTSLTVSEAWDFSRDDGVAVSHDKASFSHTEDTSNGTAANQANRKYVARRDLAATTNDDLDLSGVLTDIYGNTITLAKLKKIIVKNHGVGSAGSYSASAGAVLLVGGAGAVGNAIGTPFNADQDAAITVGSGGILVLTNTLDGWTVTAGTGDILRIRNPGALGIGYTIILEGST